MTAALERLFQLREHQTDPRREIIAGVTTFAAMAYILAVNPAILSLAGMDKGALITATALASAFTTLAMALMTNYPSRSRRAWALTRSFAFTICLKEHIPWPAALGVGLLGRRYLLALTLTACASESLQRSRRASRSAIGCGIGLFIAFIGLKNGGIIVAEPGDVRRARRFLVNRRCAGPARNPAHRGVDRAQGARRDHPDPC